MYKSKKYNIKHEIREYNISFLVLIVKFLNQNHEVWFEIFYFFISKLFFTSNLNKNINIGPLVSRDSSFTCKV